MKNLNKLLVLIIGLSAFTAVAQKADSVIVIYENQTTIVPLPAFGGQTSVSYADSNKVVEVGVWLRKPGETSQSIQLQSNEVVAEKYKNKSKWFSECEAGYIKGSTPGRGIYGSTYQTNGVPVTMTEIYTVSDRIGYQIRLSVQEREYYLNNKFSLISGFKLGFAQSHLNTHSFITISDTIGNQLNSYTENYKFRINSFQFLYQFGVSYQFNAGKIPSRISVGNSMGILRTSHKTNNQQQQTNGNYFYDRRGGLYASLLNPYLGLEIWKIGILFSADIAVPYTSYYIMHSNLGGNAGIALTYRIF